jgi:hypothetical protein
VKLRFPRSGIVGTGGELGCVTQVGLAVATAIKSKPFNVLSLSHTPEMASSSDHIRIAAARLSGLQIAIDADRPVANGLGFVSDREGTAEFLSRSRGRAIFVSGCSKVGPQSREFCQISWLHRAILISTNIERTYLAYLVRKELPSINRHIDDALRRGGAK